MPISSPTTTASPSTCGTAIQLSYDSSASSAILYPNSFITGSLEANPCVWNINGPEGSHHAIIFQDFLLQHVVDTLTITYTDGRVSNGFILYSSSTTDLPYMRSGSPATFDLVGTPIIIDSHMFRITYRGNTGNLATFKGPVIEVHLLGVGYNATTEDARKHKSSIKCLMRFLKNDIPSAATPQDYSCIVKNHYVKPGFAYPVQLYAIAGTNTIGSDSFRFYEYKLDSSYTHNTLTEAITESVPFGSILSLPSTCDSKSETSRFKIFICTFLGNDYNELIEIPAMVNPKSDLLSPVGRFTRTVSINDAKVTLSVQHIASKQYALRWRRNGKVQQKWNGLSSITVTNIKREDSGIYECFIRGGSEYDVVTYRLIVRGKKCPKTNCS
ncbi:hypothetical protein HOLleu_04036 [Holothuria leucospilota]|uniref:Ig-like domain-containing protein n=1 Tax=Holothuria leucospilota TaxID=206669 RepID=A0A9Q1CSS9_HOLLE|nr:hypothetical protein HOLleu_04036 [Holothuria leucospilota]